MPSPKRISLVITTYNWPDALRRSVESAWRQVRMPDEIIIADDGSGEETRALIAELQQQSPVPIIHSWQEDDGFRLNRSRNLAIAKVSSDYIVVIDGDIVMHSHFLADHQEMAKPGYCLAGRRMYMNPTLSQRVLDGYVPHMLSPGIHAHRSDLIRPVWLRNLRSSVCHKLRGFYGANMSFWHNDALKVNGFNEAFTGWGGDDLEFAIRLMNIGVHKIRIRHGATAFHIYHTESHRAISPENHAEFEKTRIESLTWCEQGLNSHLSEKASD
ncbi:glycosyltransferase family 2 protein [Paraferrimonas sedimenticola]|uniref:Glycosyl transferase family 2 n=1 Tax=Paraferrimonas sedimenticola TaxID=375674 RepID=A0AA37RVC6_9GAMM|nr:glycosyltransferase family 2 protein [Paraferrimonas sedimenticola]GLP95564.1 glycosyl transferase family 2 [Paraferrimonas sedimenticola]